VVDLNDEDEQALNLALNQIKGEWDFPKLNKIMEGLELKKFDVKLTGFDVDLKPLQTEGPKKLNSDIGKDLDNILEDKDDDLFFKKTAEDEDPKDVINRLSDNKIEFKLEVSEKELKKIRKAVVEYNRRRESSGNIDYGKTLANICESYIEGLK
jgi:hypothetical protein